MNDYRVPDSVAAMAGVLVYMLSSDNDMAQQYAPLFSDFMDLLASLGYADGTAVGVCADMQAYCEGGEYELTRVVYWCCRVSEKLGLEDANFVGLFKKHRVHGYTDAEDDLEKFRRAKTVRGK